MDIGDKIKKRREALGMSQEELAKKVGYKSRSSVNKIETDGRGLPQSKIITFAKALETTPAYLMGWEDYEVPRIVERDAVLEDIEYILKKYLASLGYYIDRSDAGNDYFIHFGNDTAKISENVFSDIKTKIDTYTKATIDSVILESNEKELRKKRKAKEQFAAHLLNAAHVRTDIDIPDDILQHDDAITDDDSERL